MRDGLLWLSPSSSSSSSALAVAPAFVALFSVLIFMHLRLSLTFHRPQPHIFANLPSCQHQLRVHTIQFIFNFDSGSCGRHGVAGCNVCWLCWRWWCWWCWWLCRCERKSWVVILRACAYTCVNRNHNYSCDREQLPDTFTTHTDTHTHINTDVKVPVRQSLCCRCAHSFADLFHFIGWWVGQKCMPSSRFNLPIVLSSK